MKEELSKKENNERSILVPFLVGGVIGAGVALLLAPKSGKELRKDIKDLASNTRENITAAIDAGKDLYSESKVAVKGAIDAGKQAFVEERDKHLKVAA